MSSTTGVFTITNITLTRTIDLSDFSLDELADVLGTMIYDMQESTWDPSLYTFSNSSEDRTLDCDDAGGRDEAADVLATIVSDSDAGTLNPGDYSFSNVTDRFSLDCDDASLFEISDVIATLLMSYAPATLVHEWSEEYDYFGGALKYEKAELRVGSPAFPTSSGKVSAERDKSSDEAQDVTLSVSHT